MKTLWEPKNEVSWGFMFDLVCNEHRYTPIAGHQVMDCGAHFGFFSLFCASRGAQVVAYEPDPDNFERLLDAQIRAVDIRLGGSIDARNEGLWSCSETLPLYREHHSGTSNICSLGERIGTAKLVPFSLALSGREWDCVKMDIESAEFEILTKIDNASLKNIKYLSLELHNHIGSNPQSRYEALMDKLNQVFNLDLVEKRDGRYCKAFCTRK